jgi:hypothetical protein
MTDQDAWPIAGVGVEVNSGIAWQALAGPLGGCRHDGGLRPLIQLQYGGRIDGRHQNNGWFFGRALSVVITREV